MEEQSVKNMQKIDVLPAPSLQALMRRYLWLVGLLVVMTVLASALSIAIPKIIATAIDTYAKGNFNLSSIILEFSVVTFLLFIFTYLQNIVQVLASERVARDLRNEITAKISVQPYSYIEKATPAKLLTNLTADVDAVKTFISMAFASTISSIFLIVAISVLLLMTNWRLGLTVLAVMPFIALAMFFVLSRVRKLFVKVQEAIDWLNKVISESILGASLIRLLNSHDFEYQKFIAANTEARDVSLKILYLFAALVPIITFFTNIATLVIVLLGGHFVIQGTMSLGEFTAFNSYLAILIFPIMMLGFMSNLIAQAQASYGRILQVLNAPLEKITGGLVATLRGDIRLKKVNLNFGQKITLKNISFAIKAGSKTAIIGPTGAGKTQLLNLLTGLISPTAGEITLDGKSLELYDKESLHKQLGFVFQDSVMFNQSLYENIAFSSEVKSEIVEKAIATAELKDFIATLPDGLNTLVSERGTSLSGGQKQRIMLARALALNPKILLLDDFTARVDGRTEAKILANLDQSFPNITLVSVTQKISSIEHYDQIILLMEGELLASGTHAELLASSPEYMQIYQSQQSTNQYE